MKDHGLSKATPDCEDTAGQSAPREWEGADDELAALAKALAHPARVQIVRFLLTQDEDTCICGDICEHVPLAQSTVSQHLKILRQAGLIRGRVDGPRICYCVNRDSLNRLAQLLQGL